MKASVTAPRDAAVIIVDSDTCVTQCCLSLLLTVAEKSTITGKGDITYTHTRTHTHTRLTALFRDYPGEPVPER